MKLSVKLQIIAIKPKYKKKIVLREMRNTGDIRNETRNIKHKSLLLRGFIS